MRNYLMVCATALAFGVSASAQEINTGHLAAIDLNGDQAVDSAEFDAFVASAMSRLDANADGYVTLVEGTVVMTPEQFSAANTNGDDGLSQEELTAAMAADFTAADRDGSGALN